MSTVTKAICEALTSVELLRRGWHVVNLNAINNTPNADLIAVKGSRRVTLQVKGTDGSPGKPHPHTVSFARSCAAYLINGTPFFNSRESPVKADFYVGVTQEATTLPTFLIMPIEEAEALAREIAGWYYRVPTEDGRTRSPKFAANVAVRPEGIRGGDHTSVRRSHYEKALPYIDQWHVLESSRVE